MSDEAQALADLAERALADGTEIQAEARLAAWLKRHPHDATLLHWTAMLRRALDRRDEAIAALETARRLDPGNPGLAHALAHVSLEAGRPSSNLFEQAIALAPAKAEIRLGLASARFAQGEGARALAELDAMLAANPGWIEGHRQYAQLAALLGRGERALATISRALERFPQGDALRKLGIDLLLEGERYGEALGAAEEAIRARGEHFAYVLARAVALDETGRGGDARAVFEALGEPQGCGHAVWRVRHWLRSGEYVRAAKEVEPWLAPRDAEAVWPYAELAWRLVGDPRSEWLGGQAGLCRVVDLPVDAIGIEPLRALLRRLHARSGRFLDQSVRGGTQTEGALLARVEPEIALVREAVRKAVSDFISGLPAADAGHPMLSQRRDARVRFAGSWSVRLTGNGFHTAHHHPQGWISSALYLAVPENMGLGEGLLDLGVPPAGMDLDLAPRLSVEPRPGRLVLFPSWMWHGTRPFREGERITVAFDIAHT